MTKSDLAATLSVSCVENYFLACFKDKLDIRQLYVESFVPFNKVLNDFCANNETYENYPLARVQDTVETIGLTEHKLTQTIQIEENGLTLIRVNEKFFENSKLTPWRADHYIALEKMIDNGVGFFNNYPLSCGVMADERLAEVYDNACLNYYVVDSYNCDMYKDLANRQFNAISHDGVKSMIIKEQDVMQLRNAILMLKTTRKRLEKWLEFMHERREFLMDIDFKEFMQTFIQSYDKTFVTVELQLARQKIEMNVLQSKLDMLAELEEMFIKEVRFRRVKNEYI